MMRTIQLAAACVAVLVVTAGQLQAGIITYTDQTSFMAALASSSVDDFNNLPTPATAINSGLNRTVGPYQYGVTSTNGLYSGGSAGDVWLTNSNRTDPMSFTVNTGGPTAMGGYFFASDITGLLTSGEIRVSINGGLFEQSVLTNSAANFFGWVSTDSTQISSFQVSSGSGVWPTVNDLILGQAAAATVPEPSSLALFGIGACVAGVGAARRRRREKQHDATA